MTPNKEDYLKCIYEIGIENTKISNKEIAARMAVSPPAVTEMVKKLISEGLILKDKEAGYRLTETGQLNVSELYRKHRLIEVFLVNHLNYSYDQIHDEAEILEHTVSDYFIASLDQFLDYPKTCPHGGQIPQQGQLIKEIYTQSFRPDLDPGTYKLCRVQDQIELLHFLETIGLSVGASFDFQGFDTFTQLYKLKVVDKYVLVPENISSSLFIEAI